MQCRRGADLRAGALRARVGATETAWLTSLKKGLVDADRNIPLTCGRETLAFGFIIARALACTFRARVMEAPASIGRISGR